MSMEENLGAGNESRTRDLNLGKVALYQLSYSRIALAAPFCIRTAWLRQGNAFLSKPRILAQFSFCVKRLMRGMGVPGFSPARA